MRVAVLDVGANSVRLLVAEPSRDKVRPVRQAKRRLGLGADVERFGYVTDRKVRALAETAAEFRRRADKLACDRFEVLVTSPGRQAANSADVVTVLRRTSRAPVRVLSAEEEALLAYEGATGALDVLPDSVAVVDVGGGSTQVVVGSRRAPAWVASVDVGSLRLARRAFSGDPPGAAAMERARAEVASAFGGLAPPRPGSALAVGGTARNVARIAGEVLGERELERTARLLGKLSAKQVSRRFGVDVGRARTLPAGILLLAEARRRLGADLTVARSGLREGAVLRLLHVAAAA